MKRFTVKKKSAHFYVPYMHLYNRKRNNLQFVRMKNMKRNCCERNKIKVLFYRAIGF